MKGKSPNRNCERRGRFHLYKFEEKKLMVDEKRKENSETATLVDFEKNNWKYKSQKNQ